MKAGLPAGVTNFVPGSGPVIGNEVLQSKDLAGIHITGSNGTFNHLWGTVSQNLSNYKSYPRLVGKTGGKDFVFVHPSADAFEVAANAVSGSFKYQGQKCSASLRGYVPKLLWPSFKKC